MKEIIYKGKKVKVPFEDANYNLDGDKDVVIKNRFGGEKATVPGYAAAVYDVIIGAEQFQQWETHRKEKDWFRQYFAKEYMVLLD
jgi:trimethylamine:corrinoid methyltransferase-like protein